MRVFQPDDRYIIIYTYIYIPINHHKSPLINGPLWNIDGTSKFETSVISSLECLELVGDFQGLFAEEGVGSDGH